MTQFAQFGVGVHFDVPARHVAHSYEAIKDGQPGDFYINELEGQPGATHYLHYQCPCGCGDYRGIPLNRGLAVQGAGWGWDGNEDKPTTTPSIKHLDDCKFHGFLTAGRWTGARE